MKKISTLSMIYCLFISLISSIFILFIFPSVTLPVQARTSQPIRVGYYLQDKYQEIDENGIYSGYSYDYLQELAQYNNWDYIYVTGTFSECLTLLREKKIDLMCGLDSTIDQSSYLDFSKIPMGIVQYNLFTSYHNEDLHYEDFKNFDGMKVAVMKGNQQIHDLDSYCNDHGFTMDKRYYDDQAAMEQALAVQEVDALFSDMVSNPMGHKIISQLDKTSLYFATWKGNPIITELNDALQQLSEIRPYFEKELYDKYLNSDGSCRPTFTQEELDYIANHNTIHVVFDPYWCPIEYKDPKTGEYRGITADIFQLLEEYSGLHFTYSTGNNFSDVLETVQSDTVDILSGISHDYNWAIHNHVSLSSVYLKTSVVMITRSDYQDKPQTIALPKGYYTSSMVSRRTDAEHIIYFDTIEKCLQAVEKRQVDAAYANNYVANYYLSSMDYDKLQVANLTDISENVALGISKTADPVLLSIMNKSLHCISSRQIDNIVVQNTTYHEEPTLKSFIYANPLFSITTIILLCCMIFAVLVALYISKSKKANLIKKISETDALTGLLNRGETEQLLRAIINQNDNPRHYIHAIISIDLDYFKNVNDTYGHPEGDMLLVAVADVIRTSVREVDIVGRMGGDEFLVYLKYVKDQETVIQKAEAICKNIKELSTFKKEWCKISASMGVAFLDPGDIHPDWQRLYKLADEALYHAKQNGRNRVEYKY